MIIKTENREALEDIILEGLNEHRFAQGHTQSAEAEKFGFEYQEDGKIIGGVTGKIRWDWMYIQYLWVSPLKTGKGLGKELMLKAETFAREKNCVGIHVDTFSYQAPEFYKALGFSEFGRLENYPDTATRIYLQKRLKD